jgi:hypothetical protein
MSVETNRPAFVSRCRVWLIVLLTVGGLGSCLRIARVRIERAVEEGAQEDLVALRTSLQNVPPPPLREIGTLSPYHVQSNFSVVEVGGPEHADCRFVESTTGLSINVDLHTCRPRAMDSRERRGELDLVDGSDSDLCTSGGTITIVDPETNEEFGIHFKLIGAPNGTIGWDARQLVCPRNGSESWRQTLSTLHQHLQSGNLSTLPASVRESRDMIETFDVAKPSSVLMYGDRDEMLKILTFRETLGDFYSEQDPQHAARVVWMIIDAILNSDMQRQLSEQWMEQLNR